MTSLWMFPGQGSQAPLMGQGLLKLSSKAREVLEIAEQLSGLPLDKWRSRGPRSELRRPEVAELLITSINVGAAAELSHRGHSPDMVAGYSAGEVAALVTAGVVSLEDGIRLAIIRGRLLTTAVDECARMIACTGIRTPWFDVETQFVPAGVELAGINSVDQVTLVGDLPTLSALHRKLTQVGVQLETVDVVGPWHSSSLTSLAQQMQSEFEAIQFHSPTIPILTSASGSFQTDPNVLRAQLAIQIARPVRWLDCLTNAKANQANQFIEIGAGRTLFGFARRTLLHDPTCDVRSMEGYQHRLSTWFKNLISVDQLQD